MKLAFIGDNDLAGVEADAEFSQLHGYEGIEYNFWGGFKDLTKENVKQMADIHKKYGARASMLGLWGWNHLSLDKKVRAEAHAMLGRAIEYAKMLGADTIVTGAGDIQGEPVGRKVNEFKKVWPALFAKIEKAKLKPAFYAVHGNSFFDSLETFEKVWVEFPDQVKIKFDPANWKHHGDDYLEVARKYGHKIGYIHLKEHQYNNGKLICEPALGMGDIEWGKLMAWLYQHNYNGWLSVEPHGSHWSKGELRRKNLILSKRYISQFLV